MTHSVRVMQARPLRDFHHFGRVFDDFYAFTRMMGQQDADVWTPPTDVYETDSEIVIKMSLPGVNPSNIGIEFNGEVITICGFREWEESNPVVSYHQMEIRNGYFERKIVVHKPLDPDSTRAEYKDGFLRLALPKAHQSIGRVVAIRLSF